MCGGAAAGGDVASLREEVQQLKGAVHVLTSATHLMAIPTASDAPGNAQRTSSHLGSCEVRTILGCGQQGGGKWKTRVAPLVLP